MTENSYSSLSFCVSVVTLLKTESNPSSRDLMNIWCLVCIMAHTVRQRYGIMGRSAVVLSGSHRKYLSHRGRANRRGFGLAPASREKCPSSSGKPLKKQWASDEERRNSGGKNHTRYGGKVCACWWHTLRQPDKQKERVCDLNPEPVSETITPQRS